MIAVFILMTGCMGLSKDYIDHVNRSQELINSGDYDGAMAEVDKAIALHEDAPEAYVQKGFIHLAKGELNQARVALDFVEERLDAFEEESSLYSAYLNLGNLRYQEKSYELAIEHFNKALSIYDNDPELYNAIGLTQVGLGNLKKAKEAYSAAIDYDSTNFYAYGNLASVFLREGEYDRALNEVNSALGLNPYVPQFYLVKGEILEKEARRAKRSWSIPRRSEYGIALRMPITRGASCTFRRRNI